MDYKLYLAEQVLNEQRTVTYRSLSRVLKIHANRAKQILFEFHNKENAKKPQSVHATYVISGIQKAPEPPATNGHAKNDEDEIMQSSPYLPSSQPNQDDASESLRIASIILAREEDLEDAKATFQSISTIHVYSVQPTALQDLNMLTGVCREIATAHAQDDPLGCGKEWGMIQNRNVKRRTGARPPPPAAAPAPKTKTESTIPTKRPLEKSAPVAKAEVKDEEAKSQPSSASNSQTSSKAAAKPALKREKSNLFSSFAKAKPKPKTATPVDSATPSGAENVALDDASEEEEEAEELFPTSNDKTAVAGSRESKKERAEKLKAMMEDDDADDEDMPDADEEPAREPTPVEQPPPSKPVELKEEVTVQGGRRRGKRQVMKKKTVKDEEGYLVTREEATWESFSEDEPVPKKKPAVNVAKGKGAKPGQGNIMSFFGKKHPILNLQVVPESRRSFGRCHLASAISPIANRDSSSIWVSWGRGVVHPARRLQLRNVRPWAVDWGIDISHVLLLIYPDFPLGLATNLPVMPLSTLLVGSLLALQAGAIPGRDNAAVLRRACPDYTSYSQTQHGPYSGGPLNLPFQRPAPACRTFSSPSVEKVIDDVASRLVDKDLAQLFRNAFPNTLDTTIRWHQNATSSSPKKQRKRDSSVWTGLQTFIVTGDINAEWLRDSTNQLTNYQKLASSDKSLYNLILGAIATQSEYVIQSPYCNAFQPPSVSGVQPENNSQVDTVHPAYEKSFVYECKYELDSLAHFLKLGAAFHENTGSTEFLTDRWFKALQTLLDTIDAQSQPTFDSDNQFVTNQYTFQRETTTGTETLNLQGIGNPLNSGTGLIRSAFRPSDDATILGYFIPPNAMMSVELQKIARVLKKAGNHDDLADELEQRGTKLAAAVRENGIFNHAKYGDVYAFEVDGYGSRIFMDDANIPSLLSLPYLGFLDASDQTYQNTRKMITDKSGNPYFLEGPAFHGIGGPHIGLENAWPMSLLVQAQTSDNDTEIMECINLVRDSSLLGLVHESINVTNIKSYTRPWFSWANSVFAETILKVAEERPHLIFGKDAEPYSL
ncbi:Six-hairpin glycosidase [Penicillium sp. IBT 18751x]|nr:Six-hairpin glycosidase [Penicillium sp. IBT 18751x]